MLVCVITFELFGRVSFALAIIIAPSQANTLASPPIRPIVLTFVYPQVSTAVGSTSGALLSAPQQLKNANIGRVMLRRTLQVHEGNQRPTALYDFYQATRFYFWKMKIVGKKLPRWRSQTQSSLKSREKEIFCLFICLFTLESRFKVVLALFMNHWQQRARYIIFSKAVY